MASIPVDPFQLTALEELERKRFNATVGRLKKKVHSIENVMYSQPFSDSNEDYQAAWDNKLKNILADDCGISVLASTRKPSKPVYGRQDTIEDTPAQRGL